MPIENLPPEILGFAAFALSASATPGPNNVLLTGLGAAVGLRRGIPALLGITLGFAMMIFLVSLGFGQFVVLAEPALIWGMRILGILIITWMAWQIASSPVLEDNVVSGQPEASHSVIGFWGAAAFQWVNPKAWLICASVIAAYLDAAESLLLQATILAVTFIVTSLIGCFPWLAAGTLVGRYLKGGRARIFNALMATLMLFSMLPALI
ncbi:LysE family translocator [Marinobacter hydrocarbonoclasticus]|nr:LysE family translocator [Marinobacter nauticus]